MLRKYHLSVQLSLILVSLFFVIPFYFMVCTSFKTQAECYVYPITWLPEHFNLRGYRDIFGMIPFGRYFLNTSYITVLNVIGVVCCCPLAAYSFARLKWRGRDPLFFVTLAVMMIPYQVIMVPIFMIFSKLKLVGTFWPLIIPQYFGVPFYIFLLRQFFKGLPKDLEDSARIDGCSEFRIFLKIYLPICKPAVLTIMIFQMLSSWNDFNGPLIYLQRSEMYTLQLGLQQFKTAHLTYWPPMMAAAVLISLPIILVFFIAQKRFIEGITFTGIKG
ncbi:carbohydrate ABC transporter membrane protein 2 (CUT1 family) [Hydrogenispora ethanolica]|uniref:Carbohydrate ABC transporter membrane protein 2 (CUT1 family) n=1 Tax=Hydrogenispora ethanolica TaxID=1082276 RepID=A0A4R1S9D4_HYDET|nr:carbohydrate ABC transporter permease [Hydrogenispora ethanolica]TCL75122.1 carbohydrate ABC transporter membrane protein 2 (CUT1 family) [Hydrogenispora ethanolica]